MTTFAIYQVDAFASSAFSGNPAAVVPADDPLPDELAQAIAAENNLAETAFPVRLSAGRYALRWFTPTVEVELCGHATMATAHALWTECGETSDEILFETLSGTLRVRRRAAGRVVMDLPADPLKEVACPKGLAEALGLPPSRVLGGKNFYAVYDDQETIVALTPDFRALAALGTPAPGHPNPAFGVTAPGNAGGPDFVSRFFAPGHGIDEDPVTGSAHAGLATWWARALGKDRLTARQVSGRGGDLICTARGDRVILEGECVTYLRGEITV